MKLPRDENELEKILRDAKMPELSDFEGEYFVEMLTGRLPNLRRFSHRKRFSREKDKVVGCNVLFNDARWGHFFLEEGVCKELDSLGVMVINYDVAENSFATNRIRDYVRCVEENELYIGRFNYLFRGKLRFLGYFSLSRI